MRSIFFVPPATGFRHDLTREWELIRSAGYEPVLVPIPKQRRESIDSQLAWWEDAINTVVRAVGSTDACLAGFNLGGSVAAAAALRLRHVHGVVTAGSVPRLSEYPERKRTYDPRLRSYDLTTSLSVITVPTLVQFGSDDEWILPEQARELEALGNRLVNAAWYAADHDMNDEASIAARLAFISALKSPT